MLGSKKKEEAFPVNEALLNVITPMGLEIKRNSLVIGENLGKVYGAVRYPQKVDMSFTLGPEKVRSFHGPSIEVD